MSSSFTQEEILLFKRIKDATLSNISEWDFRYHFNKTPKQKDGADELHWEATMRYYFSQQLSNPNILFRKSSRGVDLKKEDCQNIIGKPFTAELRYTYHNPPRCWNVFEKSRLRNDTNLYLILLPNHEQWDVRKSQGFPALIKRVGAVNIKLESLSNAVALAMVKI